MDLWYRYHFRFFLFRVNFLLFGRWSWLNSERQRTILKLTRLAANWLAPRSYYADNYMQKLGKYLNERIKTIHSTLSLVCPCPATTDYTGLLGCHLCIFMLLCAEGVADLRFLSFTEFGINDPGSTPCFVLSWGQCHQDYAYFAHQEPVKTVPIWPDPHNT